MIVSYLTKKVSHQREYPAVRLSYATSTITNSFTVLISRQSSKLVPEPPTYNHSPKRNQLLYECSILNTTTAWRRRFRIYTEVRCVGAHPPFGPLSRRGLNPIKPAYDPDWPDGRLNLTASAFNQLAQCTSSPGLRGYCYAELAVFFPNDGRNHRQYSLHLPTEGWPGWVGLGGWLCSEIVYLPEGSHPSHY